MKNKLNTFTVCRHFWQKSIFFKKILWNKWYLKWNQKPVKLSRNKFSWHYKHEETPNNILNVIHKAQKLYHQYHVTWYANTKTKYYESLKTNFSSKELLEALRFTIWSTDKILWHCWTYYHANALHLSLGWLFKLPN